MRFVVCAIPNVSALKECALAGMGFVLLPQWIVWRELPWET